MAVVLSQELKREMKAVISTYWEKTKDQLSSLDSFDEEIQQRKEAMVKWTQMEGNTIIDRLNQQIEETEVTAENIEEIKMWIKQRSDLAGSFYDLSGSPDAVVDMLIEWYADVAVLLNQKVRNVLCIS